MRLNSASPDKQTQLYRERFAHLDMCLEAYEEQDDHGDYFIHEAPHSSSQWHVPRMASLLQRPGVAYARND